MVIRHVPKDHLIPWQWWDDLDGKPIYIAGFPTRELAEKWKARDKS